MKNLILFTSKHGFCADSAAKLAQQLQGQTTVIDLNTQQPTGIKEYDNIIVGSSIYAGRAGSKLKKWLDTNQQSLLSRRLFLFLCCAKPMPEYFTANFCPSLLSKTAGQAVFGAEINFAKLAWWERLLLKLMRVKPMYSFDTAEINRLAELVNN